MKAQFTLLSLFFLCAKVMGDFESSTANLVITNAQRTVDVKTQLVVDETVVSIKNTGSEPIITFYLSLPLGIYDKLTLLKISSKKGKKTRRLNYGQVSDINIEA